jgi:hypothetical protein
MSRPSLFICLCNARLPKYGNAAKDPELGLYPTKGELFPKSPVAIDEDEDEDEDEDDHSYASSKLLYAIIYLLLFLTAILGLDASLVNNEYGSRLGFVLMKPSRAGEDMEKIKVRSLNTANIHPSFKKSKQVEKHGTSWQVTPETNVIPRS